MMKMGMRPRHKGMKGGRNERKVGASDMELPKEICEKKEQTLMVHSRAGRR
jgi:hypothetical protein